MSTQTIQINIPLEFNQLVDIIRQLPLDEKKKIKEELDRLDEYIIPEEHKSIVRQRSELSKADPSRLLNWDKAKKKIRI